MFTRANKMLLAIQFTLVSCATTIAWHTDQSLSDKLGLPLLNQFFAWLISIVSIGLPLFSATHYKIRIQSVFLGFACPFILLSTQYETLFYACFDVVLYLWMRREISIREGTAASSTTAPSPTSNSSTKQKQSFRYLRFNSFVTAIFFVRNFIIT